MSMFFLCAKSKKCQYEMQCIIICAIGPATERVKRLAMNARWVFSMDLNSEGIPSESSFFARKKQAFGYCGGAMWSQSQFSQGRKKAKFGDEQELLDGMKLPIIIAFSGTFTFSDVERAKKCWF